MDMKKYITLVESAANPLEVKVNPVQPKIAPEPIVHISESYESSPVVRKIVRNIMEKKSPQPPKQRNPVAKNANAAVGGGAAGKHTDKKKNAKQGVQKHKGQQLDEYSMQQFGQDASDFGRGAWNGVTLGTGDNIAAGAKSLFGGGKYKDELAKQTAASKEAEQRNPWLYGTGNVAGSLAMPVPGGAIAGGLIKGATTGAKLARGATTIGANLATQAAIDKTKNVANVSTLGYDPNKYPTTPQEIMAFQKANGLKADGVIGKNTSDKLAGMGLKPTQAVAEKRLDSQELDEYFEKEKPTDGELLLLMRKYRLAKISGKPLGSVMRQSDIHKLIDAEKDGRIEQLKYKDSIDERYDDEELDEYFEKEKPTDGELLLLMKKYRLAKISGKPLGSVMRQSDIHKLIDAQEDGRIEALKYKDSIDERYDDDDDQEYTSKNDFKRRELEHELGNETRSGEVYIDGKYWKTFDTFKQAQNVARSLERKGKRATARMLESKKPKKTAQEKLSAAVDKERKKNEPATRRAKQELDAIMPSKALAEGKVCPQCGSSKCTCPPGKCKCKPVAGFKPKMKEDKDPCWKNYKMVGTKKKGSKTVPNCVPKEGVAEGGEKYKIQSTGSDINPATGKRETYYISPSTGKKVYKDGVKKGDHENPKSGEHKPKVEGQLSRAIMKEFGLK
jgi:hypothetical protein